MRKSRIVAIAIVLALGALACNVSADLGTTPPAERTPRPTNTPTPPRVSPLCQSQTSDYLAEIQPLLEEWSDTFEVAGSTARIGLSPLVMDMRSIQREVERVAVPDCAQHGAALLISGMDSIITAFIDFMGEASDATVSRKMQDGVDQITKGLEELGGLASGRLPPTNTPVPTRVPRTPTPTPGASAAVRTPTRVIRSPTPTLGPPTPTTPPPPTPTPTQPPLGSRANPVPRGQRHLGPDGWEIVVLDFNPDAWPVVQAENQFNDPPRAGNRMVIVRLGMGNVSVDPQFYMASADRFSLVGSRNVEYTTFGAASWCGVIPDELLDKVFTGEYAEGNACFQIPTDETGLVLIYDPIVYPVVYFAVQ